jgi:hypothetical protein
VEKAKKSRIKIRFDIQKIMILLIHLSLYSLLVQVQWLCHLPKKRMLALDKPQALWFHFPNNFFNSWQPNFTYHSPKRYNILKARKPKGEIIY